MPGEKEWEQCHVQQVVGMCWRGREDRMMAVMWAPSPGEAKERAARARAQSPASDCLPRPCRSCQRRHQFGDRKEHSCEAPTWLGVVFMSVLSQLCQSESLCLESAILTSLALPRLHVCPPLGRFLLLTL